MKQIKEKWRGTMTDRERFNRQMNYKSVDRCFNMEFGYWDENFTQWDIFTDNCIKNNAQADIFFGFDTIKSVTGETWIHPLFEKKVISESENHLIIQNTEGLLAEVNKNNASSIPHYIKSPITTPDDWKAFKEERLNVKDPARRVDISALKKQFPADRDYPLGVHCGSMIGKIRDILTFEGLAYACFDYPDMVEDMVETACALTENFLDSVLDDIDFDFASGWEDICFKNGPIVSLDFFKSVVMPRYKRISRKLQAHGIELWYTDCDGDVRPILPYLLEGGINCLFPFEVNCCTHPSALLDEYGTQLRIMGGVDKMVLAKEKDDIKQYLESLVPLVERGGYIPFCDHRCPPNVPVENYLYYLDLKEQIFGMG